MASTETNETRKIMNEKPNAETNQEAVLGSPSTSCSAIPDASLKLRAFMEALEIERLESFISRAQVVDYRNLGTMMTKAIQEAVTSQQNDKGKVQPL